MPKKPPPHPSYGNLTPEMFKALHEAKWDAGYEHVKGFLKKQAKSPRKRGPKIKMQSFLTPETDGKNGRE